jgi:hypothetical protein
MFHTSNQDLAYKIFDFTLPFFILLLTFNLYFTGIKIIIIPM